MAAAKNDDRDIDAVALDAVGRARAACEAARMLCYRVIDERAKGLPPSHNGNLARAAMVVSERLVAAACGALAGTDIFHYGSNADHQLRKSLAAGVAAGTYEVQLNLVSRNHLGLPKATT